MVMAFIGGVIGGVFAVFLLLAGTKLVTRIIDKKNSKPKSKSGIPEPGSLFKMKELRRWSDDMDPSEQKTVNLLAADSRAYDNVWTLLEVTPWHPPSDVHVLNRARLAPQGDAQFSDKIRNHWWVFLCDEIKFGFQFSSVNHFHETFAEYSEDN